MCCERKFFTRVLFNAILLAFGDSLRCVVHFGCAILISCNIHKIKVALAIDTCSFAAIDFGANIISLGSKVKKIIKKNNG